MKFQIGFNHPLSGGIEHGILMELGCTLDDSVDQNEYYWKEIDSIDELETLILRVRELTKNINYSLLINFHGDGSIPYIFFDDKA